MPTQLTESVAVKARNFVREGITNITDQQAQCPSRFLVSAAPVPTALALIALATMGETHRVNMDRAAEYLQSTRSPEGWGNTPAGPACDLATAICQDALAAYESPAIVSSLIYDVAYLVARTWTQDFDRLAPGWLPKQGSSIIKLLEAIAGKPLVPSLETLCLKDLDSMSHFMPPYGRPTILAVTLIKDYNRQGLTREVQNTIRQIEECVSPGGSWCEDIVVTSLAVMSLYLIGSASPQSCAWLCRNQYDNGGWPSFNQLTNWAVSWAANILGSEEPHLHRITTPFLLQAMNEDGSFGTAPPYAYPDLDDTAIGLLGLASDPRLDRTSFSKTRRLLLELQNWDGSWGTFPSVQGAPPNSTSVSPVYIKSEDVTVHVIQALLKIGLPKSDPAIAKALTWLIKRQRPDGTWNSTWFMGQTYATAQVLDTLLELAPQSPSLARGLTYLRQSQQDGHWEMSSAGEAGLALYTLLKAGESPNSPVVQSGIDFLRRVQLEDGSFQPSYSGFYASRLYYEEPLSEAMAALRALTAYAALREG